jgi:pilus assembly protein CpaC
MNIQRVLGALCALAIGIAAFSTAVNAQSGSSVLRVARGAASQDINVAVNRAIVLEATQVFAEVSVANPGIADVAALSNQTIYILGKTSGRTTLTLLGEGGKLIANVTIRVSPDLAEFKSRLQEILPGERVDVRTANDGIVLSGTLSGARKVSRAIELANRYAPGRVTNMMSVGGTQQVMLKVRFAEVSRNAAKSLGINLGAILDTSDVGATGQTGLFLTNPTSIGGGPINLEGGSAFGVGSIFFSVGALTLDLVIDALESKGFARTLAEPTLVALSGDTASFLAGGEVPVPVDAGDNKIAIEYKSFGISLGFTPTVVDDDLINIQLAAENSQLGEPSSVGTETTTYNFISRKANTTVELRDGQSFAIAGLLQEDFLDGVRQVPWLGDLPILGSLFRSADFQNNQTELVIVISAHLVVPTSEDALSLPTDRVRVPRESELFLLGRTEGGDSAAAVSLQNFVGSYGYVME